MSETFQDLLQKYLEMTHRRAVLATLAEYLRRYLPNDLGPSQESIKVADGLFSVVSEEVITSVAVDLESKVQELNLALQVFEAAAALPEAEVEKAIAPSSAAEG
jgi:hypothetical protein